MYEFYKKKYCIFFANNGEKNMFLLCCFHRFNQDRVKSTKKVKKMY